MPSTNPSRLRGEPLVRSVGDERRLNPSTTHLSTSVRRVRRISWRSAKSTVSECSAWMVSSRSPWLRAGSRRSLARKGISTSSLGRRSARP